MDLKQMEADLAKARADLAVANQTITDRDTSLKAKNEEQTALIVRAGCDPKVVTTVTGAIDSLLERTTKAEKAAVETEVDGLMASKLVPAEREPMIALALKDRTTFDALIAARAPHGLISPKKADDPNAPAPLTTEGASDSAGSELSAAAEKRARGDK